ncbi:MlaD family protein [Mycobacteroides abscessus]|uniref:MlaD family protein n=1 Tax=Mycobacteroides abscessus TaxID=36809 RepID=UPI0009A64773|nr:MlaD family protein [Mycobacteroides abscessus]SKG96790.1 Mce family protein [Mycobacteroides abscessus subsp. massiliense]SKH56028.1 Mce family protein [Mycobacteroides abscessus subsp. massiliense]SKI08375.1 Mce family protein [Mycobacteroides abscessus subsp. massiliense]SKJ39128.1 Mce family protein [Mycobacteroides abscessus subsp. massiliense]SKJ83356.1 Mce family protein [Mycobacteroides abscessus subsp. massiliense]
MLTQTKAVASHTAKTILAVALSTGLLASSSACGLLDRSPKTTGYCAALSDASGLYRGNPVTRKGVQIGKIEDVVSDVMSVRVNFSIDTDAAVPGMVTAVSRAPSVLADRSLELINGDPSAGRLSPGMCIPLERTAVAKTLSENASAMTGLLSQLTNEGRGEKLERTLGSLSSQLKGNGAVIHDSITNIVGAMDGQPPSLDYLLKNASDSLSTLNAHSDELDTLLERAVPVISLSAYTMMPTLYGILGPQVNTLTRMAYDMATEYRGELWASMDTAAYTLRLLSEHTGVFTTYAGTLPNIADGVRGFYYRIRARPEPVKSNRVDAGPQANGMVCSRIAPNGEDHCGYFYGVPEEINSIDVLAKILKEGNPP